MASRPESATRREAALEVPGDIAASACSDLDAGATKLHHEIHGSAWPLHTRFGALFDLSVPIMLAPFGPWEEVELAAAVCESGALGCLGTAIRSPDELRAQWARLRSLTGRPFAVNHTGRPFSEEAFAATLQAQPAEGFDLGQHRADPFGLGSLIQPAAPWALKVDDYHGMIRPTLSWRHGLGPYCAIATNDCA